MERSQIIQECERIDNGIAVTFRDGETYLFHDQTPLDIRNSYGRQVTFSGEEAEDESATG